MRFFATCPWHSRTVGPRCFWREIWQCLIHRLLLNLGQSPTVAGVSTIFWMIAMVGRYLPMISFKQKNSGLSTVFCLNLYRCCFFLMWIYGNYVAWFRAFEKCRWVLRNKSCPPSHPEPLLRSVYKRCTQRAWTMAWPKLTPCTGPVNLGARHAMTCRKRIFAACFGNSCDKNQTDLESRSYNQLMLSSIFLCELVRRCMKMCSTWYNQHPTCSTTDRTGRWPWPCA